MMKHLTKKLFNQALNKHIATAVLLALTSSMAIADDINVSDFRVDLPNLPNSASMHSTSLDNESSENIEAVIKKMQHGNKLSNSEKKLVLADIQHQLAMRGFIIDKLDHLQFKRMTPAELQQFQQTYTDNYQTEMTKVATLIRASDNIEEAQNLLTSFHNNDFNQQSIVQDDTKPQRLNAQQVDALLADLTLEIAGIGYQVTRDSDSLPQIHFDPSHSFFRIEIEQDKLNAQSINPNQQNVEILLDSEMSDGFDTLPMIEIGMNKSMADADAKQAAKLKQLAKSVMHSDNLQQAVTLIANFEHSFTESFLQ